MSTSLDELIDDLRRHVTALAGSNGVAGFAVALHHRGKRRSFWGGLANREEETPVAEETLFRLSSITKIYTATAIMRLHDQGIIDIDEPVATYLPQARGSRHPEWQQITARHFLSHTSGADEYDIRGKSGISFLDDAVDVPLLFSPGSKFSVSNFGYTVLGWLAEIGYGGCWYEIVRDHILQPMGLASTTISSTRTSGDPYAYGHVRTAGKDYIVPRVPGHWGPIGAAGGLYASVDDLLDFGLSWMGDDGPVVLSAESARQMRANQFRIDEPLIGDSACLGWFGYDRAGLRVLSGSGHGFGSVTELRLIPGEDFAIAFMANSSFPLVAPMFWSVASTAYAELLGVELTEPAVPRLAGRPEPVPDLAAYVGTYRSRWGEITVSAGEPGSLELDVSKFETGYIDGVVRAIPLSPTIFEVVGARHYITFMEPTASFVSYLRVGFHALRRVE
jgi:CubicO group peptidase (beta-lactamase class C family)